MRARVTAEAVLLCVLTRGALALDPQKSLTQYSRTVWSQEHGLPQDTIRAIAQTTDGYLWLGTDEGLARFDGYEFAVFDKDSGAHIYHQCDGYQMALAGARLLHLAATFGA